MGKMDYHGQCQLCQHGQVGCQCDRLKISGTQQRWSRSLPGAILIPPALLLLTDFLSGKESI